MTWVKNIQSVLTLASALLLVASLFPGMSAAAYLSVACGSYFALQTAWQSLRERQIDVNFLMVFAAAGAVGVGQIFDAAVLLFLFSLSSTLEAMAMAKTKSAIAGLIKLRPKEAIRIGDTGDESVLLEALIVGDLVRVRPFDVIPLDGIVFDGSGTVDQSVMTGESMPVAKGPGDKVLGGTQNLDSMFSMTVSAISTESTLESIVKIVGEAQEHKASGERISVWFGQRYTVFVIGAFLVSLAVRCVLGHPFHDAFSKSLTLLVALSPCALVISTPATTLSALAWAARHGMLIRGGEFIERLGRVTTIAVDKTGTLTVGKPVLSEVCVCSKEHQLALSSIESCSGTNACWVHGGEPSAEAKEILRFAAAAEQYSSHPLAESVVKAAREWRIDLPEATSNRDVAGLGVIAQVDGQEVRIGQRRFFEGEGSSLPASFLTHIDQIQASGMTVAVVAIGDRFAALGLRDSPRPEASKFLQEVKSEGIDRIVMITGDNQQTAQAIADELGLREVRAGLLPEDKAAVLSELAKDADVMMIGDGINDAPSLAMASVGVAMGGLGSDITLNAADIVLMEDRLDRVAQVLRLGKMTVKTIKVNLIFAAGVIVTLTAFSLFARLQLPFAVIGHEGSTVIVILNGLRLLNGPGVARTA